jgi:hypothetical protein
MSNMNGLGPVPDLGAIRARQQAAERRPEPHRGVAGLPGGFSCHLNASSASQSW